MDEHPGGTTSDAAVDWVADSGPGVATVLLSLDWLLAFAHTNPFASGAAAWTGPLAGALLVGVFYLFQRSLGTRPVVAFLCCLLLATTSYLSTAAVHAPAGTITAALLLAALCSLHAFHRSGGLVSLSVGCFLVGVCTALGSASLAAALVMACYGVWCIRARPNRSTRSSVALVSLAALSSGTAGAVVWVSSDYGLTALPGVAAATPSALAFTEPFYNGLHRYVLSPGAGVIAYTPLLLFVPVALAACWNDARAVYAAALASAAAAVLACCALDPAVESWAAPGPRHLVLVPALLLLPLGNWLDRSRRVAAWLGVLGIALVALVGQALLMATSWQGVIEAMNYRAFSKPDDFVFLPHTVPLIGATELAAQGSIESWAFQGSRFGVVAFAFVFAVGIAALAIAARRGKHD